MPNNEMFEDRVCRQIEERSKVFGQRVRSLFGMKSKSEGVLKNEIKTPKLKISPWIAKAIACAAGSVPAFMVLYCDRNPSSGIANFVGQACGTTIAIGVIGATGYAFYKLLDFAARHTSDDHHSEQSEPLYRENIEFSLRDGYTITRERNN